MRTQIIEATNGFNWGKFLVGQFDEEWECRSVVSGSLLLRERGHDPRNILVLDLETREGAVFLPCGLAKADLNKHRIWVCPLFEPFLAWLYEQDLSDVRRLPASVVLIDAPSDLYGYRRSGGG